MNFLAHFFLAQPTQHSIIGNMMGDFTKGIDIQKLPEHILNGIYNHRAVDKFTDKHPLISELKTRLPNTKRRFAGITLDITFDYFLSKHWHKFTHLNRETFIQFIHEHLRQSYTYMPYEMEWVTSRMLEENWLRSYAQLQGISNALQRASHRLRFENPLNHAIEEVLENYAIIEQTFLNFFPKLQHHIKQAAIEKSP